MAEKTKGRKRHIVTDTMGNLLAVKVHAANIHDTVAGGAVLARAVEKYPTITGVCADAGYRKTFEAAALSLGRKVDISEKIKPHEREKLPWRWIVERTFGWMNNFRRLSKDYEIAVSSAECMTILSNLYTLLKKF